MGTFIVPNIVEALTDVVGVLLHDVSLQQVVRQHEGALLHRVQQRGGGPQLLSRAQLLPCRLRLRLQQVVDRCHHGLQSPQQRVNEARGGRLTQETQRSSRPPGFGDRRYKMGMEMK